MPCDEQGVWIGPRNDAEDTAEDPAVALKRFEDELAEFQRLGEERWPAGDDEALIKVSLPDCPNTEWRWILILSNNRTNKLRPVAQKQGPRRQQDVLSVVPGQFEHDACVV